MTPPQRWWGCRLRRLPPTRTGSSRTTVRRRASFPSVHLLEVDVNGQQVGNAGDFEAGDMPYSEAGPWAKARLSQGVARPVVYFQVSSWASVAQSLASAGVSRNDVRLWTAHYTGQQHTCSSACGYGVTGAADATQWASSDAPGTVPSAYRNRNIDVSITADDFSGPAPPVPRESAVWWTEPNAAADHDRHRRRELAGADGSARLAPDGGRSVPSRVHKCMPRVPGSGEARRRWHRRAADSGGDMDRADHLRIRASRPWGVARRKDQHEPSRHCQQRAVGRRGRS